MPADVSPGSAASPFDALVAEWVLEAGPVPRRQKQRLLREEMRVLDAQGSGSGGDADEEEELAARRATLQAALSKAALGPDAAVLRRAAAQLTVATDLDALYAALDPGCTLALSFSGRTEHAAAGGVDDVVEELCEQQESILACRGDLATGCVSGAMGPCPPTGIVIHGMSAVRTWCCEPSADAAPSPRVGTRITYYGDAGRTAPLFSLHTAYTFTADGATVEHIARTLLPHDDYSVGAQLREIHFGSFGRRGTTPQ